MNPALFLHLMSIESRRLLSYRVDFWITMILTLIVQLVVIWALWTAIFAESGKDIVAGWDLQGILAYGVFVFLTGRVVRGGGLQEAGNKAWNKVIQKYVGYR